MARGKGEATLDRVLRLFPVLRERLQQRVGHAVRRRAADAGDGAGALPRAEGAAARRADRRADAVDDRDDPRNGARRCAAQGVATILVEQRVDAVLAVADRVAFIENGRVRETVDVEALRADPALLHHYVGVGH